MSYSFGSSGRKGGKKAPPVTDAVSSGRPNFVVFAPMTETMSLDKSHRSVRADCVRDEDVTASFELDRRRSCCMLAQPTSSCAGPATPYRVLACCVVVHLILDMVIQ